MGLRDKLYRIKKKIEYKKLLYSEIVLSQLSSTERIGLAKKMTLYRKFLVTYKQNVNSYIESL